ncbi:VirD4-like conjugal transfer protein, CD1115 family [Dysosmobacter sp.]|uniref:VirD4-like conjugal transfer protein, CD1115 family n=1 Tax=Dysosmobacter sp. TaxID=2591382 RepID=UPI003AEF41C1
MCLNRTNRTDGILYRLFFYLPVIWAALLIAQSLGSGLPDLFSNLTAALEHPFQIQWTDKSLLTILICTGVYIIGLCIYDAESGRTRDGEEHGSAAWGSPRQLNAQFRQKQNKILTRHVRLGLDTHKHRRSLNVLVIGGSGAAKTRGYVKPNILEANSNYVITDPKMEVLTATGGYLKRQGYDIRVLNLVDLSQSDGYNPFRYLRDEKDALKLVNTLIQATTPKGSHESDPFWTKSETALLQAIILMLFQEAPEYEQNFSMVMRVLEYAEVKEDDDEYVSPLDLLFRAMEYENPESVALRQYKVFKQAAGKTAKSILISCGARLAPFDIAELRELMSYDEMELDTIGDRKTALFVIISDTDDTFNFVVAIMYSQLFNLLCDKADDVYNGRLPVHVRCLLDEFANIGQIPKFDKLIATIRSREISASIILQSQSQLKTIYKDAADTITGNCDCTLFLGGKEKSTLKEISEVLGKETIDLYNTSETRSNNNSYGLNYQKTGKELMSQDEIAVMDGAKCILQLRGVRPFLSSKYDITKHPKYRQLSDYDKRNAFDIEKYRQHKLVVKPDDTFDLYDMGEVEAD